MAQYSYKAINKEGKKVGGRMSASNPLDLESRIKDLQYDMVDYKQLRQRKGIIARKIKPKDMISFCVHMEELDRAGVPVLDSLIDLRDTVESAKMRDLLSDLVENIRAGDPLSVAIKKKDNYFDDLFCGLISVGEETGNIGDSFGHLSKHIKWQTDFRRKIKKAVTYPIVLMVVMVLVVTIMMIKVVPQLVEFLSKQGIDLPWYTRWLIATSEFFVSYWWVVLLVLFLSPIILFLFYRKVPSFKYMVDKFLLNMPVIGTLVTKINLARFVKFFSITFTSGLGVLESLDVSRKVVTNSVMRETIDIISLDISNGSSITEAIAARDSFPSLVVRMFRVGEESANIDRALANVNFFYEREIDDTIETMVALIQPLLLVIMGGMLMWIIASVFGPVYGSFSKMKF